LRCRLLVAFDERQAVAGSVLNVDFDAAADERLDARPRVLVLLRRQLRVKLAQPVTSKLTCAPGDPSPWCSLIQSTMPARLTCMKSGASAAKRCSQSSEKPRKSR